MTRIQLLSSVLVVNGILVFSQPGSAQTRGFGVVNGEVKSESGEQVAGVTLKFMLSSGEPLSALVGKDGKDGKWRAVGVGQGEWKVQVAAPGYAPRTVTIVVEQEEVTTNSIVTVLKKAPVKPS